MPTVDLTASINLRDENSVSFAMPGKKQSLEIDSNIRSQGVQTIGFAAHEAVNIGDISLDGGFAYFRNLDDTNFVEIGLEVSAAFVPFVTLLPGQWTPITGLADKDIYAKADTANVELEFLMTDGPTP